MHSRKSTGPVNINTKLSLVESVSLPVHGDYIQDYDLKPGCPVSRSSDDPNFLVGGGQDVVFMNWTDYSSADAQQLQGDPFQDILADRDTQTGTLTAVRGNGCVVEIPTYMFSDGSGSAGAPEAGHFVLSAGDELELSGPGIYTPVWSSVASPSAGDQYYGIIEKVEHGKVTFQFSSPATRY